MTSDKQTIDVSRDAGAFAIELRLRYTPDVVLEDIQQTIADALRDAIVELVRRGQLRPASGQLLSDDEQMRDD